MPGLASYGLFWCQCALQCDVCGVRGVEVGRLGLGELAIHGSRAGIEYIKSSTSTVMP